MLLKELVGGRGGPEVDDALDLIFVAKVAVDLIQEPLSDRCLCGLDQSLGAEVLLDVDCTTEIGKAAAAFAACQKEQAVLRESFLDVAVQALPPANLAVRFLNVFLKFGQVFLPKFGGLEADFYE